MKLELDLWCRLLDVYSRFQINISKHVEKKPGKLTKIQNAQKTIAKILKIGYLKKKRTYVEKYTEGYLRTKFERFLLIYESIIAKNEFD